MPTGCDTSPYLRLALLVVLQVGGGHPEDGLSSNPSLLHNHVTLPSQASSLPDLSRQQDTYSGKAALHGCRMGLTCARAHLCWGFICAKDHLLGSHLWGLSSALCSSSLGGDGCICTAGVAFTG